MGLGMGMKREWAWPKHVAGAIRSNAKSFYEILEKKTKTIVQHVLNGSGISFTIFSIIVDLIHQFFSPKTLKRNERRCLRVGE